MPIFYGGKNTCCKRGRAEWRNPNKQNVKGLIWFGQSQRAAYSPRLLTHVFYRGQSGPQVKRGSKWNWAWREWDRAAALVEWKKRREERRSAEIKGEDSCYKHFKTGRAVKPRGVVKPETKVLVVRPLSATHPRTWFQTRGRCVPRWVRYDLFRQILWRENHEDLWRVCSLQQLSKLNIWTILFRIPWPRVIIEKYDTTKRWTRVTRVKRLLQNDINWQEVEPVDREKTEDLWRVNSKSGQIL